MKVQAEYIWIDGAKPTAQLRSKTKIVDHTPDGSMGQAALAAYKAGTGPADVRITPMLELKDFPEWGFDGSSTYQAEGHDSDCVLKPVAFVRDPIRKNEAFLMNVGGCSLTTDMPNFLVMCEVFLPDGVTPHPTNTRAELRRVLDAGAGKHEPWFGIEQEYALYEADGRPLAPLRWEETKENPLGTPIEQGPFYCSVGASVNYGREVVERHTQACLDSGLLLEGTNAEVAPGQHEFQVGAAGPLEVSDHLWFARWLLHRIGEDLGVAVSLDAKPFGPDFNGSGAHTNVSTSATRFASQADYFARTDGGNPTCTAAPLWGMDAITAACEKLREMAPAHIAVYGHGIEERLTGIHETCSHLEFRYGVADRGASIRIPRHVGNKGYGYFEDRRPCANIDPYVVTARILRTICDID